MNLIKNVQILAINKEKGVGEGEGGNRRKHNVPHNK